MLNEKQRQIVHHIMKCIKTKPDEPFHIFLSGSTGVGKSTVINVLYQTNTKYYDNLPGDNPDSFKVLLTAFSGKAAFLINGTTLHTAFALPINQFGGKMPKLSDDIANSLRAKLKDVKIIIPDEISMIGILIYIVI